MHSRKAVIDVGSNSVLLLVEERQPDAWTTVFESSAVTSLGRGARETGKLSEEGIVPTLAALKSNFDKAHELGAVDVTAAATMAARITSNVQEFLDRAHAQGTPVTVLSGQDEAQLGFESVAYDPFFAAETRITIIDVGGQSTELVTAERGDSGWEVLFGKSFPIGTLALKGSALIDECPSSQAILQAVVEIDDAIGLCYRRGQCGHVVALGATATNLVTVRDEMPRWDPKRVHGMWLDYEDISQLGARLMRLTEADRARLIGMEPGREATLPAGALILERYLDAIGANGCSVSVRGWRHALLERGLPKTGLRAS